MTDQLTAFSATLDVLQRLHPLDERDRVAVQSLPFTVARTTVPRTLLKQGDRPNRAYVLLKGLACRYKLVANGGRQITAFFMPGDIIDVQLLEMERIDHSIQTITPAEIANVSLEDLRSVSERPAFRRALSRASAIDASIGREWITNIGRRAATARVAHFLCEFGTRLEDRRLGVREHFAMPVSQEVLGDALGLTAVHVNRTMRQLVENGLIKRDLRKITIVDWKRMQHIADFDPAYLHLQAFAQSQPLRSSNEHH